MILLTHEPPVTAQGEKAVEALLEALQLSGFDINNGRQFTVAIQSFLVSEGKLHEAHTAQSHQPQLQAERQSTAETLAAFSLQLELSRQRGRICNLGLPELTRRNGADPGRG